MVGSKPLLAKFGIHQRLESCFDPDRFRIQVFQTFGLSSPFFHNHPSFCTGVSRDVAKAARVFSLIFMLQSFFDRSQLGKWLLKLSKVKESNKTLQLGKLEVEGRHFVPKQKR